MTDKHVDATFSFAALPPLSLYIHVPWCISKCPYCDFNSHVLPDKLPEHAYIDALICDLEQEATTVGGRSIETIFIGGGTPSLLSADAYNKLLSSIRSLFSISADLEITLEANPSTCEAGRFADYRALGINRLSIGVQSFHDSSLRSLGRAHNGRKAIDAITAAHHVGFDNINLDLMFGLPQQSKRAAEQDINTAIALAPTHLSYYQLTIEPHTLFANKPPPLPDEDAIIDWQIANQKQLNDAGYQQYEVSAYAKKNKRCRHNMNYWQFADYMGIGAGAHGKISDITTHTITRRCKQKKPQAYLEGIEKGNAILTEYNITHADIGFEFMLNALRLTDGFAATLFYQHTGLPLAHIDNTLNIAKQKGLLQYENGTIRPTKQGKRYLNTLIELFLPP